MEETMKQKAEGEVNTVDDPHTEFSEMEAAREQ